MPIKLPKGFVRRKSSGNALEEVANPPEPSFRVFERPDSGSKSFDGTGTLKRMGEGHPSNSPLEDHDNLFAGFERPAPKNRGSGGTNNSGSTGGLYDSSSSARLSSSSTLPSSTDVPIHDVSNNPHARTFHDIPPPIAHGPRPSFSLHAAGRTFSFGTKAPRASTPQPQPPSPIVTRDRTMTASTASTATPPKLPDTELKLGGLDDDFGNMFEGFGQRKSGILKERSPSPRAKVPSPAPEPDDRASRPAPIDTDRSKEVEPSPYSWDSRHSQDGLLGTSNGDHQEATAADQQASNPTPLPTTSHRALDRPERRQDQGLRRSVAYATRRDSTPVEDADAKLVRESVLLNRRSVHQPPVPEDEDSDKETSLFDGRDADKADSASPAGRPEEDSQYDFMAEARLAVQFEEKESNTPQPRNKVMTPAQFERYRQQRELARTKSDASKSDDSDASSYSDDDDDETEKTREAEKLRRKQEAHLAVYRQQMMKVTGEKSPSPRPNAAIASSSTPNLSNLATRLSTLEIPTDKSGSGKSSDGDEDDDVPLGILAAHGFPNKTRPPTRLTSSSSNPNLRASFHPSSAGSISGDGPGARGSLPVFARNLPQDPYFGASLVIPSNRESLAMGGGASAYGGPSGPSPALPPGGLVGVIATEERARAMRRGSPRAQPGFDLPGSMMGMGMAPNGIPRPYTMASMASPGMSGMPSPSPALQQQGLSVGEQAQLQMSQQMTQMMQMQMQWMQHMMQMQGGPQIPMNNNFLSPMNANMNMRPKTMAANGIFNGAAGNPRADQRTFSMLDPGMSRWNTNRPASFFPDGGNPPGAPQGQGYAPSIAPSERSNIGRASRYRPVSIAQPEQQPNMRASTFTSSTLKPWNDENRKSTITAVPPVPSNLAKSASMATVTVRPLSSNSRTPSPSKNTATASDDEDDEEGWAEMMKKREKKKSSWKMKKTSSGLGDLLHAVH
ncbi:hypothetical protein VTN02DRAFT_5110 [Thermoascus thermophilus]